MKNSGQISFESVKGIQDCENTPDLRPVLPKTTLSILVKFKIHIQQIMYKIYG